MRGGLDFFLSGGLLDLSRGMRGSRCRFRSFLRSERRTQELASKKKKESMCKDTNLAICAHESLAPVVGFLGAGFS